MIFFWENDQSPPTGEKSATQAQQDVPRPLGGTACSPSNYERAPYTMLMGIQSAHKSNRLFESPLDPLAGKSLSLLSFPPHALLRYTSIEGESVPPERHLQAIRELQNHRDFGNTEQLFVPLSVVLEDGREMIGLWIHRGNGRVTPQWFGRENQLSQRPDFDIYAEEIRNQAEPVRESLEASLSETGSMISDIIESANQQSGGLDSLSSANVGGDSRALAR